VQVTERRTAIDYAHLLQHLVDCDYPEARKITVVQDNLNTHSPAPLQSVAPAEARRILVKYIVFTHQLKIDGLLARRSITLPFCP
jgi:hypothetical protein